MTTHSDASDVAGASIPADGSLRAAVVDALPELVFVLDRDGNYVDVLGGRDGARYHDGRKLIGRTLHDVLPEDRANEFLARIREALETGEVVQHDYRLSVRDVDGVDPEPGVPDDLWFEGRAAPVASGTDRDDLVVWIAFNVTAARVAERRLQEQKETLEQRSVDLAESSENRQRLMATVSHDLFQPLTAVKGVLELLDARWEDIGAERARELLRRGVSNATRMEQMLTELREASRRSHVGSDPEPESLHVEEFLSGVVATFDEDRYDIRITRAHGRVHADPGRLERILVNLLDNARKYGQPPIELSTSQDGDRIRIHVQDHGPGVHPEFVDHLFDAFTQARPAETAHGGVGLGLSIVRQFVGRMNGTVDYEHNDTGACFTISLPSQPPEPVTV